MCYIKLSQKQHKRNLAAFLQYVMQYRTTVCSALHLNTAVSVFKFLFVFFLSEYSRKHDTVSGNPNQGTLITLARLWPSTKTPFKERFIVVWV